MYSISSAVIRFLNNFFRNLTLRTLILLNQLPLGAGVSHKSLESVITAPGIIDPVIGFNVFYLHWTSPFAVTTCFCHFFHFSSESGKQGRGGARDDESLKKSPSEPCLPYVQVFAKDIKTSITLRKTHRLLTIFDIKERDLTNYERR